MKVAVAQINAVLGDFAANTEKILQGIKKAGHHECDLLIFPESTLFGYHPFDLLERAELVEKQIKYLSKIHKKIPAGLAVLIGVITKNNKNGRPYFNSAALLIKGQKPKFFHKELLPTGDVFDEARFIEPGQMKNNFFKHKGEKVFLTICEDIWAWTEKNEKSQYKKNPLLSVDKRGVDLVVNMSASPFYPCKFEKRKWLVQKTANYFKAPMVYVNLVGAQDEIIFDGGSFALDSRGNELLNANFFSEELRVFDSTQKSVKQKISVLSDQELMRKALVLGIKDYCAKNGLFKIHLGLSGGIDSALVACLAVEALGPSKVKGYALPGPFSSELSLKLAVELARKLKIEIKELEISSIYETTVKSLEAQKEISGFSVVHENIQARLRGLVLMAISNQENSLLLTTSNKSEYATGYSTLYGDMCGGLAPIGDLTKKQVYDLANHYNREREVIPEKIISRPPTAELRANQKDQDTLPPYEELDRSVVRIVEQGKSAKNKTDHWLLKTLAKTEFKRWQAPPILKVSQHSFGRGRRWPISHRIHNEL